MALELSIYQKMTRRPSTVEMFATAVKPAIGGAVDSVLSFIMNVLASALSTPKNFFFGSASFPHLFVRRYGSDKSGIIGPRIKLRRCELEPTSGGNPQ